MPLTDSQKRYLRGRGHALKAVVLIGQAGCTPNVRDEFDRALTDHELVKVKVRAADRAQRDQIFAELAQSSSAAFVQRIGNVALYYRAHPERPRIMLPDA